MSRTSLFEAGAQETRLLASVIFLTELLDEGGEVEFLAESSIELSNADIERFTKFCQRLNALQQFTAELLLNWLRQAGGLPDCEIQCLAHVAILALAALRSHTRRRNPSA